MIELGTSAVRWVCIVIASMLFTATGWAGSAQAGGWDEFLKRCVTPMEAGGVPAIGGLDLVDKDPIGQAFDLPGTAHMAVRPPFGQFGIQCQVVTQPVQHAKDAFDAWIVTAVADGTYALDEEIESRWLSGVSIAKPLAMDVWQEGDWMVFQVSFLEAQS